MRKQFVKTEYSEKLRDPRWQKTRLQVMERDSFTCQNCGDDKKTLNVHHCYYEFGKNPWEYEIASLLTLCEECHKGISDNFSNQHPDTILRCLAKCGLTAFDLEGFSYQFDEKNKSRDDLRRTLGWYFADEDFYNKCNAMAIEHAKERYANG